MHEQPDAATAIAMLELVASERPGATTWLLDVLRSSPVGFTVAALHRDWQTHGLEDLAAVVVKAAWDLDRLEERLQWRHPRQVDADPHIPALRALAAARRSRVLKPQRLEVIEYKLKMIEDQERLRRKLAKFIREPGDPVDPAWLRDFLGQTAQPRG